MKIVLIFSIYNISITKYQLFQTTQENMKKCYVHPEVQLESRIRKCFVKADVKNEIIIEEHDKLDDNIYYDNVSQFIIYFVCIKAEHYVFIYINS